MTEPERCAECGFDSTHLTVADAVASLRSMGRRFGELFRGRPDEALRHRPAPGVWSALEYAGHTRDLLGLFAAGLPAVLDDAKPSYPAVEPDPPGTDHGYNELDPGQVLDGLAANANALADVAAGVKVGEHWDRTATIGTSVRSAAWLLFHAVHDASHHLRDVEKGLGGA